MKTLYEEIRSLNNYEEFCQTLFKSNDDDLIEEFYNNSQCKLCYKKNRSPIYFDEYKDLFLITYLDYLMTTEYLH